MCKYEHKISINILVIHHCRFFTKFSNNDSCYNALPVSFGFSFMIEHHQFQVPHDVFTLVKRVAATFNYSVDHGGSIFYFYMIKICNLLYEVSRSICILLKPIGRHKWKYNFFIWFVMERNEVEDSHNAAEYFDATDNIIIHPVCFDKECVCIQQRHKRFQ